MQFSILTRDKGIEEVAAFLESDGLRRGDVGLNFVGIGVGGAAKLERGEAAAVDGHVDRSRGPVKRLPDHEHGLAVGIATRADERNVGGESYIAGRFLPGELEVVDAEPHVLAAAAQGIGAAVAVILCRAGMKHSSDVLVIGEDAMRHGFGSGREQADSEYKDDSHLYDLLKRKKRTNRHTQPFAWRIEDAEAF